MSGARFGSHDQESSLPGHIGLFHHGGDELRERAAAFLRPALTDTRQGVVLLGPPGVPRQLWQDLERTVGTSLEDDPPGVHVLLVESESDPDAYLDRIRSALDALLAGGSETVRALGRVVWNAPDFPLPEDHLWLESRVTDVVTARRTILVCAYDVSELPGAALLYGGLETHAHVMLGDRLSESPRFLKADRFLRTRLLDLDWLTPEPRAES